MDKSYYDYLEMRQYFALPGEPTLTKGEFLKLRQAYYDGMARLKGMSATERATLKEIARAIYKKVPESIADTDH